tara:strand:+ start:510 stop:713 length:204 start_codon:yes stop_codon:yes gene_type:complete
MLNIGLVSDPTRFNIEDIRIMPTKVPKIILYEATFVYSKTASPIAIAIMDVSPTEPGMLPRNASNHV